MLKSLRQHDDGPATVSTLDPGGYESSDVPSGYDTVGHWWAVFEAEAFEMLRDPLGTIFGDSETLQTQCEERGIPFCWVKAGWAFSTTGLVEVRAFPTWLLSEFYTINP